MNCELKKPFTAVAYVIIFLCIQTVVMNIVLLGERLLLDRDVAQPDAIGMIITMVTFTLLTIGLFAWRKWTPLSRRFILSRPWAVLFWAFIASIGAIIPSVYLQELLPEWSDSIQQDIEQTAQMMFEMMNVRGGYAVICLLAPIAEEMVFRGAALRTLLAWKPEHRWLMIMLSALLFALAHLNPAQFIHPLLIGLLLGWMYERTRSIVPGIIYHWSNNTVAYLLARIYQDPDVTVTQVFGSLPHVLMAVGFSLLIFLPALYQLHLRMKQGVEE